MTCTFEVDGTSYEFEVWENGQGAEVLVAFYEANGESFAIWTSDAASLPASQEEAADYIQNLDWAVEAMAQLREMGYGPKGKPVEANYLGRTYDLDALEAQHGTYEHNGKLLYLIQQPYPSDIIGEEDCYTATALDHAGRDYRLVWPVANPDADDGSDACDWDDYKVIEG